MKPVRAQERSVRSFDGTEIAYYVGGAGPVVLFGNGIGLGWRTWSHQMEYLLPRFRVISWDYRGLYASMPARDRGAMTVGDHARDALAILEAEGIDRVTFVGRATGVQVGLELFRDVPERIAALVLVSGVAGGPFRWVARARHRALGHVLGALRRVPSFGESWTTRVAAWPETVGWAKRFGLVASPLDDELLRELVRAFATSDLDVLLRLVEEASAHDAHDVLRTVDVPTLVISGDRDPLAPRRAAERIVRDVPGAELMIVPGGTHYVMMEFPELVNLRLEKFFRERGVWPDAADVP